LPITHRFFLLPLFRDFPGGRAYFISPRVGRTYPGPPPPEVEGLVKIKMPFSVGFLPGFIQGVSAPSATRVPGLRYTGRKALEGDY